MNNNNWLIKNIRITDPAGAVDDDHLDLLITDGTIRRIGLGVRPETAQSDGRVRMIDGSGLWLWPGLVDAHVHFREPGFEYKENFFSGSRAAARGGYSSVICEPNTEPSLDSAENIISASEKAQQSACVHVYFKAAMSMGRSGRETSDYARLAERPEVVALSDDGDPVSSHAFMDRVCRNAAGSRLPLCPHCEDSPRALADRRSGVDFGFQPGPPYSNETRYIERDARTALRYGCRIHFSHLSLQTSIQTVDRFRNKTTRKDCVVSCEAAPHHLLLCRENYSRDAAPRVNPPLRSKRDMEALQRALADGQFDAVASDHAPHSEADKQDGACGLTGLETTLGLVLTHFVKTGVLSPSDACRLLSTAPAQIFSLDAGTLRTGAPADIVIIDPEREWTVNPEETESRSRNTPFGGWRLTGKTVGTMVAGAWVYMDDALSERRASVR